MALLEELVKLIDQHGDGNGKVDVNDATAFLQNKGIDKSKIDDVKQKADRNGDGKVDLNDLSDVTGQIPDMFKNLGAKK